MSSPPAASRGSSVPASAAPRRWLRQRVKNLLVDEGPEEFDPDQPWRVLRPAASFLRKCVRSV